MLDDVGGVLLGQTFDPYGNPYDRAVDTSWVGDISFGFAGEMTDSNGLIFLRARYYNPSQGRFSRLDPLRATPYLYRFASGNPVMRVDPSGLFDFSTGMIQKGDCLSQIAKDYFGDAVRFSEIVSYHNSQRQKSGDNSYNPVITDPNLIFAGYKLYLPPKGGGTNSGGGGGSTNTSVPSGSGNASPAPPNTKAQEDPSCSPGSPDSTVRYMTVPGLQEGISTTDVTTVFLKTWNISLYVETAALEVEKQGLLVGSVTQAVTSYMVRLNQYGGRYSAILGLEPIEITVYKSDLNGYIPSNINKCGGGDNTGCNPKPTGGVNEIQLSYSTLMGDSMVFEGEALVAHEIAHNVTHRNIDYHTYAVRDNPFRDASYVDTFGVQVGNYDYSDWREITADAIASWGLNRFIGKYASEREQHITSFLNDVVLK